MKRLGSSWIFVVACGSLLLFATASARSATSGLSGRAMPAVASASQQSPATHKKVAKNRQKTTKPTTSREVHRSPGAHHTVPEKRGRRTSVSPKSHARNARGRVAFHHGHLPLPTAESRRLNIAFVASSQLRPMAQQLVVNRSPAAYAAVTTYAAEHRGKLPPQRSWPWDMHICSIIALAKPRTSFDRQAFTEPFWMIMPTI